MNLAVGLLTLKEDLICAGADAVGFGDVSHAVAGEISHLVRVICVGLNRNLNERTLAALNRLQKKAAGILKAEGYRYLCIPPDSDRVQDKFISKLYPLFCHKTAATCSGLGWIGKSGLVVNPEFGPKMSWATILTDAPLETDEPTTEGLCGECDLCVKYCPSGALTGASWSRSDPFGKLIDLNKCRSHKNNKVRSAQKPNCGLCITICPYGRKKNVLQEIG
jgi:epoxyqueuosine reductase